MNQASAEHLAQLAVALIVGFGLAFYIGSVFITALPAGIALSTTTNILTGFGNAVTVVLVPAISIVFILWLYAYIKSSGLLGGGGGRKS